MLRRQVLLRCAALLCAPALPVRAEREATDAAVTRIQGFYNALLSVMKQGDKLGIRGRYDKLAPTVRSTFDLAAMTRIAVGPEWNSIPPEQQAGLFRLLKPEEIGVQLTEGFMMEPEASVSALVFHHPDATYFSVGASEMAEATAD